MIVLDPTVEERAFGINLLTCQNLKSYKDLSSAFGLAWDFFVKVFGDPQTGELGILLNKYLRNTLYPFLENQGHTLLDLRTFLLDKPFRNRLLQNVSLTREVVNFWQGEYELLSRKDKVEQIQSTLNRLDKVLTDLHVKHIVGQVRTTIDFVEILNTSEQTTA